MISVSQSERPSVEIADENDVNNQLDEPMDIDTPGLQKESVDSDSDKSKLTVVGLEPISSPTKSIRQSIRETLVPSIQPRQMIPLSRPRLVIEKLILTNFKSYAGRQEIGPFHPSFSAVVGPNGSGKSNVIDSMLFVFGFRASKMRQSKLSELIHNSEAFPGLSFCQVDIHFKRVVDLFDENNQPYSEYVEGSEMIVSRRANRDNSSKYFVDDKSSSYTEVTNLLKDQGVDLDHKRFLILQGEVESIAQMKPKADNENDDGLLEYLEDIIGTTKYKAEIEKIDEEIEKLSDLCSEKESRFKFAKKSMNDLDTEKSKALEFLKLEKRCINENTRYLKLSSAYDDLILKLSTEKLKELQGKLGSNVEIINKSQSIISKLERDHTAIMKSIGSTSREIDILKTSHKSIEQSKVSLSEKMKHTELQQKKALKVLESNNKTLNTSQSQLRDLKDNLANYEKESTGLNDQLEKEKGVLDTIKAELSDKTKKFSEQIDVLQKQLEPWKSKIDNKQGELNLRQSEIDILTAQLNEMENEESEVKKIIENKKEQIDINKAKVQKLKSQKVETEANIHKNMTIFQSKENELKLMETSLKELRDKVEYAKANVSNTQSQNRVTAALQHLKDSGRLRGFYGRLGDLGVIDDKYDVAVSTGCGSLHDYVVETVEDAQQCIQYLRTQNVGFGRFIVLQKLRKFNLNKINTPENVSRLFDLITFSDPKFAPAFYSSMFDTLVTPNLQVANRVAFGGKKRWRVVTMDGKLVDISGTMSGGGSRVSKGAMKLASSKSTGDDVSPQQLEQWRNDLRDKENIYNNADSAFRRMEQVMRKAQDQLPEMGSEINRLNVETESLAIEIKENQDILKELLTNKGNRNTISKTIAKETKILTRLKDEKFKLENDSKHLENQISDLQQKIMDVGGMRLKTQISKVNSVSEKIHLLKERKESDDMKVTRFENQINKLSKQIDEDRIELEGFAHKKQILEIQYKEKLVLFDKSKEKIDHLIKNKEKEEFEADKLMIKLEDKRVEIEELNEKSRESLKMIKKYEYSISHATDNIERIATELESMTYRNVSELLTWLDEGDPELISLVQGSVIVENLSEDELKNLDFKEMCDRVDELKEKLSNTFVNLDVLLEYGRRHQAYLDQKIDLENSTNLLTKVKEDCEFLKKKRFEEFQAGFQAISSTLREMYHMITMGGNAELEFFDSHDPFSEGVVFSVMPPKKSWRNIGNLSGGEKTLASLALVFALHHYKPTPLYVMDEIDAALDFRNVSIVANYIKGRTRNAQFIVISLRNNMFELAERLVGIYKTNNMTKSATLVNKDLL